MGKIEIGHNGRRPLPGCTSTTAEALDLMNLLLVRYILAEK